jgi:hypothetical protein
MHWQETDFIAPLSPESILIELNTLVEPIQLKDGRVVGFKINGTSFSMLEAEQIFEELGRFL